MTRPAGACAGRAAAAAAALAALLTAGCVTLAPAPPPRDPAAQREWLATVTRFTLDGRLSAAVGDDGFTANLSWRQRGTRSELDLRAPLGFGAVAVRRDESGLRVTSSRGEQLAGDAATAALAQQLGFEPPLDALPYWVRGVPDPARPAQPSLDAAGRLVALEQDGWRIEYESWREQRLRGERLVLPQRLRITRPPVRLRLLVSRWRELAP